MRRVAIARGKFRRAALIAARFLSRAVEFVVERLDTEPEPVDDDDDDGAVLQDPITPEAAAMLAPRPIPKAPAAPSPPLVGSVAERVTRLKEF